MLQDVCCVACLSVDIHKHHSDQVKSIVDVANGEKKILNEHLQTIEKLQTIFSDEQKQLQTMLHSKYKLLFGYIFVFIVFCFLDLDVSEAKSSQEIETEFDRIINNVQARREVLKKATKGKVESTVYMKTYF